MSIDNLAHEHLPSYIRVQPVYCEAGVHLLACSIVEVWLQVYEILLLANPAIDLIQLLPPLGVSICVEGVFDVARVDGHQGQEDGADVVGLALLLYFLQVIYDVLGREVRSPQAVGASEHQKIQGLQGQYVRVKTVLGHGRGVAAPAQVQAGEIQIGGIAVLQGSGRVGDGTAAVGDAVAQYGSPYPFIQLGHHEFGRIGPGADDIVVGI